MNSSQMVKSFLPLACLVFWIGCAHPLTIHPPPYQSQQNVQSKKTVAYVMSDADRKKEVTTAGGGGDKVKYQPYRDLERVIRDVLKSVYGDVSVVESANDPESLQKHGVTYLFQPEFSTSSKSSSFLTWPPTEFKIEMMTQVTDAKGQTVTQIQTTGKGSAEYSEFMSDFGLAGRRAAEDLRKNLEQEIRNNPKLK